LKTRLQAKEITSSDFIYFERSRSQKIPDSSLFTDKKNSTWKNWYEKIQNKLEINVDLFSNKWVKLSYIHSRLFNDAAEITQARRERDYVNLYRIINDFLKELAQLFNDLNKKVNFRREYYNLIQEFKKFNEFYTQFQRLSFYLDYHEKQLIADLKDKIHLHLQFIWVDQLVQSDSLKEIRFYLIHLNNDQRVIREIKNKIKRVDDLSKTIFHRVTVVTQSVDHLKSDQLKSHDAILTNVKETDILVENCFICHKFNHSSKECLDQSTRINAVRLIVESSFHIYFLTRSSTQYQCRDLIQILDINLVIQLDIDLESSQNSSSRLDSSSNRKFRIQWKEILITTSKSFLSRVSIFRIHENTDYY